MTILFVLALSFTEITQKLLEKIEFLALFSGTWLLIIVQVIHQGLGPW